MKNPCHNCEERELGCHGRCKRYIAWSDDRRALREKATAGRILDLHLSEEPFRAIERSKYVNKKRR